ncbi:ABC transporter permease subunit [Mycobacterium sp. 21AC1]|uniref:ABC transporter permease subunit n=1 Tax=[Mycobacterium] appelbergii TaxID=2939269 RepID=UPI0029390FD8|nr:ABC transporter permease subunit [Mycobacterium sp. 21AC1]MDV3124816.1 ABC transporter permease subunit [Mycobacterium sp. 21AC1]
MPAVIVLAVIAVGTVTASGGQGRGSGVPFAAPSPSHWLGTDARSEDVLTKLAAGGTTLALIAAVIAVGVTVLAATLGAFVALRPRWGATVGWLTDVTMLIPPVLLMLLVLVSWPQGGIWALVVLAVVIGTPYTTRVLAGAAAPVAGSGYVQVAEAAGESLPYLVFGQVLPNLRETIATQLGLRYVEAIYVVSTAAFLQLIPAVGPSNWAVMVRENASGLLLNPASVVAPALAIAVLAVSVNVAVLGGNSQPGRQR